MSRVAAICQLFVFLAALSGSLAGCAGTASSRSSLTFFAAASLRDLAADLGAAFEREYPGIEIVYDFAGSNTLAQQIAAAPRVGVFVSADGRWVDFLDQRGRTVPASRRPFLTNSLVVVARTDSPWRLSEARDLPTLDFHHLALAEPSAVPAGRYAKTALEAMGLWTAVEARVAPTADVRAALALVESDPEIAGIVYRTDALVSRRVRVLAEVPAAPGKEIVYWAVAVTGGGETEEATAATTRFLGFLGSTEAREVAERYGFGLPERAGAR